VQAKAVDQWFLDTDTSPVSMFVSRIVQKDDTVNVANSFRLWLHVRHACAFVDSMASNIAIAFAPVVYYATCAYETVAEFAEEAIERTGCRIYLW